MSDIVKGIMTINGVKPIDYESLANLPTIDNMPTRGSKNAVQSGAVYTALEGKLDAQNGKAADSILFGGQAPEYYATAEKVQNIEEALGLNADGDAQTSKVIEDIQQDIDTLEKKFNVTGQALDAEKLGGQLPSYYATDEAVKNAQSTADNAMPKSGGKFTGDVKFTVNGREVWLSFTDENNEPTDEPYVHWYAEE